MLYFEFENELKFYNLEAWMGVCISLSLALFGAGAALRCEYRQTKRLEV